MASEKRHRFYSSKKWLKCRAAYIKERQAIDGGLCEVCHERPGYIVHHKIWLNDYNVDDPLISLNFDNLRFECQYCHNLEDNPDGDGKLSLPKLIFDDEGNVYARGTQPGLKVTSEEEKEKESDS